MEKKTSSHLLCCIICGLLTAFGIVASIISLIVSSNTAIVLCNCFYIIILLLTFFYAFVGYKKPHGNQLKYILLFYAVANIPSIIFGIAVEDTLDVVLVAVEIGLLCYIAGRLERIKQNQILMIIVAILELKFLIVSITSGYANLGIVCPLVICLDICVAYFLRYKEHKEAGLIDAPKSK